MKTHIILILLICALVFVWICITINGRTKIEPFSNEQTTIITAFYPVKSKRSSSEYIQYATTFMKLASPVVLFTNEEYASKFKSLRPEKYELKVIVRPFELLETWKLYKTYWQEHYKMDHEQSYHSPELYAVWAQKPFFVEEIVKSNPFNTKTFYWCDIGAFRDSNISPDILLTFPRSDILQSVSPAIILNSVEHLTKDDVLTNDFKYKDRIVGGLWGGTDEACIRWKNAYQSMLEKYFSEKKFAGKEQSVMISTYIAYPSLAVVVKQTTPGNIWFFQQQLLSSANAPFEVDESYSNSIE